MKFVSATLAIASLVTIIACRQRDTQGSSAAKSADGGANETMSVIQKKWVGCYKQANADEASARTFCLKVEGDQISLDPNNGLDPYVFGINKPIVTQPNEMKVSSKQYTALTNDGNSLTLRKDRFQVNQAGETVLRESWSYTHNLVPGESRQSDKITQIYNKIEYLINGTTDTKHGTVEFVRQ